MPFVRLETKHLGQSTVVASWRMNKNVLRKNDSLREEEIISDLNSSLFAFLNIILSHVG
jgi:hypothetical protein